MTRSERIFSLIEPHLPDVILCGDMLVVRPTGHVVRGFLLEATTNKDSVFVWRVVTPLYRPMNRIFLDYSMRIADGQKIRIDRNDDASANVIRSLIEGAHIEALKKICGPQDFLDHVSWMIGNSSINFRFDLALTYYLVGEEDKARELLCALSGEVSQRSKKTQMPIDHSIEVAAQTMSSNVACFGALLRGWEQENIEKLGLQASRLPMVAS